MPALIRCTSALTGDGDQERRNVGRSASPPFHRRPRGSFVFIRYTNPRYRYKERKITLSPEMDLNTFNMNTQPNTSRKSVGSPGPRVERSIFWKKSPWRACFEKRISFDMCRWTSALMDLTDGVEPDKIRQKLAFPRSSSARCAESAHSWPAAGFSTSRRG